MAHGPVRPCRYVVEDAPAGTVFSAVWSHVGARMARIETKTRDHDEHVRRRRIGRVDAHPPPRAWEAPADVILRERVVAHDFRNRSYAGAVQNVVNGARTILFAGTARIRMSRGPIVQLLQLVAGHDHR